MEGLAMRSLVSYTVQSKGPELVAFNEGEERLQCARLYSCPWPSHRVHEAPVAAQFENSFRIEDLGVFDDIKLRSVLNGGNLGLTVEKLAWSLHDAPETLVRRVERNVEVSERASFMEELHRPVPKSQVEAARRCVLDRLFWELTYWKTPELYEELIEGEYLHPGIFQQLEPDICGKIVLDAGAGSGRVSF